MNPSSRVIALQSKDAFDMKKAEQFGQLLYLTSPGLEGGPNVYNPQESVEFFKRRLIEYGVTGEDYLLQVGSLPLNTYLSAAWLAMFGRIRLLIYGRRDDDYCCREISSEMFTN